MASRDSVESPQHGYRGAATPPPTLQKPRGLTVAISREAGSRGGTLAATLGRALGWPVYTQEMLDFLAHDEAARNELLADLPDAAQVWAAAQFLELVRMRGLSTTSDTAAVARLIYVLGARGDTVLVGRGAGFLLPIATTIHVRIIAPPNDRVAYLSQWLRLTSEEAEAEVKSRDRRRAEFLSTLSDLNAGDPAGYDLVVNSARLGLEACVDLIAVAVRSKQLPDES